MASRRACKVAEAVREVVASAILFEIRDPRVQNVTVTRVEISDDLQMGKIYVSVMGDVKQEQLTLRGLESARGFLQSKVAKRIQTRYTPHLSFYIDEGLKHQLEISRILREVLPPDPVELGDEEVDSRDGEENDESSSESAVEQ